MTNKLTQSHLEAIITAAIDADMKALGFIKAGDSFAFVRGESDVEMVPGPGGAPTGEVKLGTNYGPDGTSETVSLNATTEVYEPWRTSIEAAFKGWKNLPESADFSSLHGTLDSGTSRLSGGGGSAAGTNTAGDVDLAAALSTISTELAPYAGATVDAFQRNYVTRMGPTFANQSLVGSVLTIAAKTEADLWTQANENIVTLATNAKTAFEESSHGGGGGDAVFTVLGILAATAGLIATGGAAAPAIAAGGTVIGIIKDASSLAPKEKSTSPLAGDSPGTVYSNMLTAIRKLSSDINTEEVHTANMLWDTYQTITGPERSNYDLSRPTELFGETDINKLNKTDLDTETLKRIGNTDMPGVAGTLRSAATQLDIGGSGIWNRDAAIGHGYTGPHHEASTLSNQLMDYLTVTGQEVEDAGEILVIAANNLSSTDSASSTALTNHQSEIEAEPTDYGRPARNGDWILPSGKHLPI